MTTTGNTWEPEVFPMIRVLISDSISPYTYSENQIREFSVVAASLVLNEISFDRTYVVDVSALTITPDPQTYTDTGFMNFIALKTACLVIGNEARQAAKDAVRWTDGPSTLNTEFAAKELVALHSKMCKDYRKAKLDWAMGPGGVGGYAIFTPTTNSNVYDYYHPIRYNY